MNGMGGLHPRIPGRCRTKLLREIHSRVRRSDEQYRAFSTELGTMMRRTGGFTSNEQLTFLFDNMHSRLYIPRGSGPWNY